MPLTWSKGCAIGAIGARRSFLALKPFPTDIICGNAGKTKQRSPEPSMRHSIPPLKFLSSARRFVRSPFSPNFAETRAQRLPGWAGGQSYYVHSLKVYGPELQQSPYLSTVKPILPVRSSGFVGDFPRSPNRSPRSSPPRSPQDRQSDRF